MTVISIIAISTLNVSQTRDFTLMRSYRLSLTHMAAFVDNARDTVDTGEA